MKNHWLDKKIDKEIDKAFEEFKDTDFIDLSCYKEYDKLELQEKFIEENVKALDPFDFGDDEHDRAVVTEILLKYKDKSHWIDEVLADVGYYGHATLGNLTIDTTNAVMFDVDDNFTIALGDNDGTKLGEVKTSEFGQICSVCNEEMWPMNTATTMCQGDPACACSNPCGNLDSWYPDQKFIQNETLQVYQDHTAAASPHTCPHTQFITTYTPVLPGTMTGTIYPTPGNHSYGFVFTVSTDGNFDYWQFLVDDNGQIEYPDETPLTDEEYLQKMVGGFYTNGDNKFIGWYDELYADKSTLNCQTGILDIHYHMGKRPEIVVSYEYQKVDSL